MFSEYIQTYPDYVVICGEPFTYGDVVFLIVFGISVIISAGLSFQTFISVPLFMNRRIRTAQNVDIGGVTLLEGIQALYGADGMWSATDGRDAWVTVTRLSDMTGSSLRIGLKTKEVEVLNIWENNAQKLGDNPQALIGVLAQAALDKKKQSET